MWPLGPDVVEECRAVAELPAVDSSGWAPLFDPVEFNEAHAPLQVEDYRLPQEEMKTWAERTIRLRAAINDRAQDEAEPETNEEDGEEPPVRGRGIKRSRPEHNSEGRTEKDLREQAHQEMGAGSKLKKRRRKDLPPEEIESIVAATLEPFGTQHVVARKFRVTPSLVGRLVRESVKKPEALQ